MPKATSSDEITSSPRAVVRLKERRNVTVRAAVAHCAAQTTSSNHVDLDRSCRVYRFKRGGSDKIAETTARRLALLSSDDNVSRMARLSLGLETLLDLDGDVYEQEAGFWIKIEAKAVAPDASVPHGIRYSLTLHDRDGKRVLGYDNAHSVRPPKRGFGGRRLAYDHKHRAVRDKGVPYEFESPQKLLEDFFAEVDRVIRAAREGM